MEEVSLSLSFVLSLSLFLSLSSLSLSLFAVSMNFWRNVGLFCPLGVHGTQRLSWQFSHLLESRMGHRTARVGEGEDPGEPRGKALG